MLASWESLKQRLKTALDRTRRRRLPRKPLAHAVHLLAVAVPVFWIVQHVVLGPGGIIALHRKQVQLRQQMAQLHQLEDQNRQLNQSIQALRSDPNAIEGIAREQLHLTKPGEVVYTYPTTGISSDRAAALHR